jgi:hypothetical protein
MVLLTVVKKNGLGYLLYDIIRKEKKKRRKKGIKGDIEKYSGRRLRKKMEVLYNI